MENFAKVASINALLARITKNLSCSLMQCIREQETMLEIKLDNARNQILNDVYIN